MEAHGICVFGGRTQYSTLIVPCIPDLNEPLTVVRSQNDHMDKGMNLVDMFKGLAMEGSRDALRKIFFQGVVGLMLQQKKNSAKRIKDSLTVI